MRTVHEANLQQYGIVAINAQEGLQENYTLTEEIKFHLIDTVNALIARAPQQANGNLV